MSGSVVLVALLCGIFPKVHMVFDSEFLMKRDKNDFEGLWEMFSISEQVEYHIGCDFVPEENALVIIDEADALIFRDALKFRDFTSKNACICFTAPPDSKENKMIEEKVVKAMQLTKFYY